MGQKDIFKNQVPVFYLGQQGSTVSIESNLFIYIKDGPFENLWGGRGRTTKKIFAQGNIKWKKIHARQLALKKFMLTPKKNS